MSYDGIVMRAVTLELDKTLRGARIDKIYQPNKNEISLLLRQPGQSFRLMLSTIAQEPGVYLTKHSSANPTEPPLFCMLLRKHLEGGKIASFEQHGLERVMLINCDVVNELGEPDRRRLIVEIMGKHSNVVLLNQAENRIYDALHRITPARSRYRQLLPGLAYQPPPPQEKLIPWEVRQEGFYEKILSFPLAKTVAKILLSSFSGLGPQTAEEIVSRSGLSPDLALEFCGEYELSRLWQSFHTTAQQIKEGEFSPEVIFNGREPLTFSAIALTSFPPQNRQSFTSMNEAVDFYYSYKRESNRFKQAINNLAQIVRQQTEKMEKKAGLQLAAIREVEEAEHYRLWGELLTANLYTLAPGKKAEVANYYHPDTPKVVIPLEENLSVLENAQQYFKKYQKAKNAAQKTRPLYAQTQNELNYLYSLANSLENAATEQEVNEIKEELQEAGYLKSVPSKKGKPVQATTSSPSKAVIDGWEIYFGRNNKQNDFLVTKIARGEDLWFHTKDIPGSHVLIKNPKAATVPPPILEKAALLAAYHSKARFSTNVPVDYTLKKHVWKPKGARPGMVHYENQRTLYVTPETAAIDEILKSNH